MNINEKGVIKVNSLAYALNGHYVSHFIRCYKLFDGDLESCIILGEIAFYNAKEVFSKFSEVGLRDEEIKQLLKGCNAYSISLATGIPRETVRRKVKKLKELGFISADEKNQLIFTNKTSIEFSEFTKNTLELFFEFMSKIKDDL